MVDAYCSRRHPELPKFILHGPYTPTDWRGAEACNRPGCYVIHREGSPRVGKSAIRVGDRLNIHLSPGTQAIDYWQKGPPKSIDIIEVQEPWEAASLEEFLEARLITGK